MQWPFQPIYVDPIFLLVTVVLAGYGGLRFVLDLTRAIVERPQIPRKPEVTDEGADLPQIHIARRVK